MGNGTTDFPGLPFLRPAFVYNNKRPVILSFRSFRFLGQHWAETIHIISLTRYAPKPPLCVTPFSHAMFIVSVQANKGMKVNESRKTSVILVPSHIGLACTTGALWNKLYGTKSEANTIFPAYLSRLAQKAPVMQAKPICKGDCAAQSRSIPVDWLLKPHQETKAKPNVNTVKFRK